MARATLGRLASALRWVVVAQAVAMLGVPFAFAIGLCIVAAVLAFSAVGVKDIRDRRPLQPRAAWPEIRLARRDGIWTLLAPVVDVRAAPRIGACAGC